MSFKSVQFMAHSATNMSSLAERVYVHPNISPYFYGSGEHFPSWYHGENETSTELADYLSVETNREKIAVLLHYLHGSLMRIDYEKAFAKCCHPDIKNMVSVSELSRLGIKPGIERLSHEYFDQSREALEIYTNTDTNFERKTRDPQFTLVRTKNILALSQAIYLLGIPSKETRTFKQLLDMAISSGRRDVFEYLIHSNMEFDLDELVFKIIDKGNSRMLKELCRRGYKVGACVKDGVTAIEYAVGIIPDEEFDCFFYKAGRLVYQDPSDAKIMHKVKSMMKNSEIITKAIGLKKYKFFTSDELTYDIPRNIHKKIRTKVRKNQPVFADKIEIHKYDGDENINFNNNAVAIRFGSREKYYATLSRDAIKVSDFLEDTIGADADNNATIVDLENMVTDPEEFSIVLSFMKSMSEKSGDMVNGVPPAWMNNLFDLNLPTLMGVYDIASYLDIKSMYGPLSFYINKEAEKYNTEELRFIISMMIPDMNFEMLTFRNVIKCNGFGYGEV